MTRLCFIDTETTSLNPDRGEVYEIGLVVRDPASSDQDLEWRWWLPVDLAKADPMSLKVGRFFERRPPERHTWPGTLQWAPGSAKAEKGNARKVAETVMELTVGARLVGAVPSFDQDFLRPFLYRHGCCPAWHYHLVDVEALAAGKLGIQPPWDSGELSRKVGVDPDDFDRHTALGDARWARAIYDAVMVKGGAL